MITPIGFTYKKFNFPCGEMHIRLETAPNGPISLIFEFQENADIIELLLLCEALKRTGIIHQLFIPYVPFGRQDRVSVPGECFSLWVFANLINTIGAEKVIITDPHSDVTTALLNNCQVISQADIFAPLLKDKSDFWLISPDAGALKKIYTLSTAVNSLGVVECSKKRNVVTGEITGVNVQSENLQGKDCYIVDDICDGGRTFTEIAKVLKEKNPGEIILLVTHGFFTKGLGVFDGLIDRIYTRKGRVK